MEYHINEGGQLRSLTREESKLVETTKRKVRCMAQVNNGEGYNNLASYLIGLKNTELDWQGCVMYQAIAGSSDRDQDNQPRGTFTKFDFEGEQNLAGFVARQFSEQIKGARQQ